MIDIAAAALSAAVTFIATWLYAMHRCDAEYTRLHHRLLREMRTTAELRADLLQLQRREAAAAANVVQLSGALTNAAAQRVQPGQLGADVRERFCWN